MAQLVKNPPAMQEIWFRFLGWEDPWRRRRLPTPVFWPGELRGLYSPQGGKELDTTEQLSLSFSLFTCRTEALTEAVTSPEHPGGGDMRWTSVVQDGRGGWG